MSNIPKMGHLTTPDQPKGYIWVNYNDLTVLPNPGIMVNVREIIPKWPNNSGWWIIITYPDIWMIPSGQLIVSYWKWPSRNSWFTYWKWWFSIVMLVYQRVYGEWCEMLNNVDMKWLEMIGVLNNSRFAENSEICVLFLPFGWLNIPWNHGWIALGSPKLCCLQKNQCWKRKNTSRRCRTAAGPRSTPLRSARLLFSPEKKMYNDTSRWVVVKHVRVAGSVFVWGWET